jgi:hypothetical protein
VPSLREALSGNARPVAYGPEPVSWVRSLYFDDHRLSSCRESLAGVSHRAKLRLRWYDEPFATRRAFLELKRRHGWRIRKQRVPLALDVPLEECSHARLRDALASCGDAEHEAWLALRGFPSLLVGYRRQHFVEVDGDARITLDWDVRCTAQSGASRLRRGPEQRHAGLTVVEVKTSGAKAADVRRLLHPLAPRLARCSKYVQGCLATGLDLEHEIHG